MALYRQSGVSVESWIEMRTNVPMRCEVDQINDQATLFFGQGDEYVMVMGKDNLQQVVSLGTQAIQALNDAAPAQCGPGQRPTGSYR